MGSFFRYFLISCFSLCLLSSCEDEEDVCKECQDAIDHMYGKLSQNQCNPDYMENAMNRLISDCGQFSAQNYAGFMAHSCANESNARKPECISADGDIVKSFLTLNDVHIDLQLMSTRHAGDTVLVEIALANGVADNASFVMIAGSSVDYFIDGLADGQEVDVIVSNLNSDEVILQETVNNRFWRTGYWSQVRSAQVHYLPLLDEYDVVFNYW